MFDDTTNAKYLFGKKTNNTVFNFTMLRPMNRGVTITPKTRDRMSVKGLVIEKSANVGLYGAVYKGDVITYTITLKNSTATAVNSVKVTDVIGPAASYVAGSANAGASVSGKNIAWTTDVSANATVKLSYQVKVAENTDQKALLSTGACVNNLPISEVQHTISGYTAAQIAKVVATANKFISDGRTFSNATEMLKAVYKESLSVDVFTHTKVSALLADLIDSSGKVARTDTAVSKMIVPNLYGGKTISNRYLWDNDRVRMVREEYLATGDLIVADFNGGNKAAAYVYLGGGRLLAWYSGKGGKVQEVSITKDAYTNILVTLIAYERYAVLRPSLVA